MSERDWFQDREDVEEQEEQEASTPKVKEDCPAANPQTPEEREERRVATEAKAKKKGPISKTGQGRFNR